MASTPSTPPVAPTFREAFRFWLKLGFISFGGPTGQIAIMHAELVEKKRWISEERFLHALNYCMLLPGPEAQQLAVYVGWLLHRTRGGIVAGALFVLPSALILWGLSLIYTTWGNVPAIAAVFDGLKPAVLAIVLAAVLRIGKRALRNEVMWALAAVSFAALFFFGVAFPWIVAGAGVLGFAGNRYAPRWFSGVLSGHGTAAPSALGEGTVAHADTSTSRLLRVTATCAALWWAPIVVTAWILGTGSVLFQQGVFFSKAAMVTFGGAYAVLPYVSQQAVSQFHWLSAGQMLDGLALAETTPGPLIMVLQFVGFVGGWNQHEGFSPLVAATLGAAITTWSTFLPCFLWIFAGAPYIEKLRGDKRLTAALSAITAAVVGVVLNLAVWFGLNVLVPRGAPVNTYGIAVTVLAFFGMQRWKWDVIPVVLGAGLLGLARWALL